MYGKSMTHLVRLAGIINSLNKAFALIENAPNVSSKSLTLEYIQYCQQNLVDQTNYIQNYSTIEVPTLVQAETLLW